MFPKVSTCVSYVPICGNMWYYNVLGGIRSYSMVFGGNRLYYANSDVLAGTMWYYVWYSVVLVGIKLYSVLLGGTMWYYVVLCRIRSY
jgi:hypothetical protein